MCGDGVFDVVFTVRYPHGPHVIGRLLLLPRLLLRLLLRLRRRLLLLLLTALLRLPLFLVLVRSFVLLENTQKQFVTRPHQRDATNPIFTPVPGLPHEYSQLSAASGGCADACSDGRTA